MKRSVIIGSRGSKLALWQAEQARTLLVNSHPSLTVSIEIIKTTGDVQPDPLSVIGGKGVFTKELEDALLGGRIDLAVHSLKDLPTSLPDGLSISAICERDDPRDALVLKDRGRIASLHDLRANAVVGTSSPRRLSQLKSLRPDVLVKDLRGNVDTRIRKLDESQYDALVLAAAGLNRLGLHDRISLAIPIEEMLPAVGQGAIAIETRSDDPFVIETVSKLDHENTSIACRAERSLLRNLGGGCQLPIAAHAVVFDHEVRLEALVASPEGTRVLREILIGSRHDPDGLGSSLAATLNAQGAASLLSEKE